MNFQDNLIDDHVDIICNLILIHHYIMNDIMEVRIATAMATVSNKAMKPNLLNVVHIIIDMLHIAIRVSEV